MHLFAHYSDALKAVLGEQGLDRTAEGPLDLSRVTVEPPRDASHGDLATNAAMVLAKPLGRKPRDLAEEIVAALKAVPGVASAEIAGPGFINLRLDAEVYGRVLAAILAAPDAYGRGAEKPGRVNVEYVSANPTGPMHVGHCRGAVVGDALASLLAYAGFDVTREYYINDAGAQVDVLARSAFLRYREALGEDIGAIPEGFYPGDYLKPVGEALKAAHGAALLEKDEAEWLPLVRQTAIDRMMAMIREDLAALNVVHDVFFSEKSLQNGETDRVGAMIAELRQRGLIYEGTLPPPKGQLPEDWEDREQTLFRATDYGDDVDRPLMKSDGSYTYFASDIAYHADKVARGFGTLIDVWGADHGGYVKRMSAAVEAVSNGSAVLDVKLCQLVKLLNKGEPVRMGKRSGNFVTLRDVVDEVGVDAVRFMMIFRKNDASLDFDFAKVTEQSKDNAVFYVQYGHARCASILRNAGAEMGQEILAEPLSAGAGTLLADEGEAALLRKLAEWPRLVDAAAEAHEPHRIAFYLHELASTLHAQWNRGKDLPELRFIKHDDRGLTAARLGLVRAVKSVLAAGLGVLGVSAPEEMR
ncbi:MAG: arginine--tRNA ligase [Hyphomicrobiaceae bacterium]|nr:arginine--tRNA ligase [Hyphomicrobiaceae bacterium]